MLSKRIVLILVAAVCVYLAGNARMGLWDRDEPRYSQCSRQMLQSGNWVVPRIYDQLRPQKPPFIYWCQAVAMQTFGDQGDRGAFSARVPSVVAMVATLTLLAIVVSRHDGQEQAMWTIFVLASSAMAIMAAKICLTDSVLIFFIVVSQLCLYAIWQGRGSWTLVCLMAAMFGLGLLTKGPFIIGIVAFTAGALGLFEVIGIAIRRQKFSARRFEPAVLTLQSAQTSTHLHESSDELNSHDDPSTSRESLVVSAGEHLLRFGVAILIIAIIVTPWLYLVHQRAPEFLPAMFKEGKAHALAGKEGHTGPPGYHFVLTWAMFMPWSLFLPSAIFCGIQNRQRPEIRFALAAVVGPWIMVEFMGTKLPHYFLAAYPALAYLMAFWIRRSIRGQATELRTSAMRIAAGIWALAIVAMGLVPWLATRWFDHLPRGVMVIMTFMTIAYGAAVLWFLFHKRDERMFWTMGTGMLAAMALVCAGYVPNAPFLRISIHVADVLKREGAIHRGNVRMVDYKEPSLGFYQGGTIREESDSKGLLARPVERWPTWVVMSREVWSKVPDATKQKLLIVDSYRGWAYADRGRIEDVMVVRTLAH